MSATKKASFILKTKKESYISLGNYLSVAKHNKVFNEDAPSCRLNFSISTVLGAPNSFGCLRAR
ncbi:hypothetical protein THIOM_000073 [Candidatus Thiomargarita nelsonii]|uniref:Uncharacterized protein n=1 Tax=Candidatus Thiomargarita nelsonii TaxID=1003181 RepID=A0A176S7R8_9GAMM|nr:hypothetical protein THIOM_000073 [Candidatus Thiomargarita nelsonii]